MIMNIKSALINKPIGKQIKAAMDKYPATQIVIASLLRISTKQLRNYANGVFPKYKGEKIAALDKLLKTNAFEQLYGKGLKTELSILNEAETPTYREQRMWGKIVGEDYFVPLIPYKARAGYSKNYENIDFINQEFDTYQIPPGVKYRGSDWRWFEVGGDSMEPILAKGDFLLCSLIPEADWLEIDSYLIYVVVWENDVSVKRVAIDKGDFILISENVTYDQRRVPVEKVKEVWKLRRQLNARFPPTRQFKIKV